MYPWSSSGKCDEEESSTKGLDFLENSNYKKFLRKLINSSFMTSQRNRRFSRTGYYQSFKRLKYDDFRDTPSRKKNQEG